MSINLAALDVAAASETPFDLELKHPKSGEKLGLVIQVAGSQSAEVRGLLAKRRNEALKKGFEAQRGVEQAPTTAEEIDQATAEILAAATVGWHELKAKGKAAVEKIEGLPFGEARIMFSREEALKLYLNPGFKWLADQVDKAVYNVGNFIKG